MAFDQHLGEFVAHSFARDLVNLRRKLLDGGHGCGLDGVLEARGEAHSAQHSQLVFSKTQRGVADSADDFRFQVLLSADVVQNFVIQRIKQQAVDGEVAALHVFAKIAPEAEQVRMAAVTVSNVEAAASVFHECVYRATAHKQ